MTQNMATSARRRRSLCLELLEKREVFAGDVTAVLQGGNLIITGDSDNNNVVVTRGALGEVVVTGGTTGGVLGTETTINSSLASAIFTGVTGDLIIDMREGNDQLLITNVDLPGSINATLGSGNDTFSLQSRTVPALPFTTNSAAAVTYGNITTAGSAIVYGNAGNDALYAYDAKIGTDLIFYGDIGNDTFTAQGLTTADATIGRNVLVDMGFGDDTITASRVSVGDSVLIYDGGASVGSTVTLTSLNVDRNVRMYLSIASDTVIVRGEDNVANRFFADDLVIFTGDGTDNVTVENAQLTNFTVDTGAGDEGNGFFGIQLRQIASSNLFWVNSGDGFDNILIENGSGNVMRVFGGSGSDGIIARNIAATDAVFDTGDFGDVVGLYDSNYERLVVGLYAGIDQLYLGNITVSRAATFDGGDGSDSYFDRGGNNFQASNRVSIESVS